jgi:carboxyl-terminal processing protease
MRRTFLALCVAAAAIGATAFLAAAPHPDARAANNYRLTLANLAADSAPARVATPPAGVRACEYVPGVSVPAVMPPEVLNPAAPTPTPVPAMPPHTTVSASTTSRQLAEWQRLWDTVNAVYADPGFNGVDWLAVGNTYKAAIGSGLSDTDFYTAMKQMVGELHDDHSHFQTPQEVADEAANQANGANYVGIGIYQLPTPGSDTVSIIVVYPNSPAAEAGLRPHDVILQVDGGPLRDSAGNSRVRGTAGTTVTLTVQRPGEAARTLTLTRRAVTGFLPIDYCLMPSVNVGYILVPNVFDATIADQVRTALQKMTANGPLAGVILDNRLNSGGSDKVAKPLLGFFTSGLQGHFVSRTDSGEFRVTADDIGGSQSVPLAVLVGTGSVSFGEITSGVLGLSGRATILGVATYGNVELLRAIDFDDGARAWIAVFTFQPLGKPAGFWEGTGIVPSVRVPTRWDLFAEATDPAVAKAVDVLLHR